MSDKISLTAIFLIGLLFAGGWDGLQDRSRYTIDAGSRLWVEGTSSLHDWSCEAADVKAAFEAGGDAPTIEVLQRAAVTVPTRKIGCGNGTMDRKMRDALRVEDAPVIHYVAEHLEVAPAVQGWHAVTATGKLTIAGTTRSVKITLSGQQRTDGRLHFKGHVPIQMRDFGIEPPSAMLGTLKTGDKVEVHFDLLARSL